MGAILYANAVLASSPRAYWKCQDVSPNFPVDSSPNGLNMTSLIGTSPQWQQPGPMADYSITYQGGQGHRRATQISTVTDNLTMEWWSNPSIISNQDQMIFNNGNSGTNGWGVLIDTTFKFQYLCGGVAFGANSTAALAANVWSHVVVVRRSGTWVYYINGSVDTANAGTDAPGTPSGPVDIGGGSSFLWSAAHIAVYETALSAGTISAHYAAALALDPASVYYSVPMLGGSASW
jgi:hypothetical protein